MPTRTAERPATTLPDVLLHRAAYLRHLERCTRCILGEVCQRERRLFRTWRASYRRWVRG